MVCSSLFHVVLMSSTSFFSSGWYCNSARPVTRCVLSRCDNRSCSRSANCTVCDLHAVVSVCVCRCVYGDGVRSGNYVHQFLDVSFYFLLSFYLLFYFVFGFDSWFCFLEQSKIKKKAENIHHKRIIH